MRPQSEAPDVPAEDNVTDPHERRTGFARLYGAHPWHLLSLLACFAVTGYAVTRLLEDTNALLRIAIWFVGAAVVWDFVLGPLMAVGDRGLRPLTGARVHGVSALNFVRFPLGLSLLLLLVWTPLIFQRSEQIYRNKSDLPQDPYLGRWVAVTVGLFVLSGLAYAVAVLRARRGSSTG